MALVFKWLISLKHKVCEGDEGMALGRGRGGEVDGENGGVQEGSVRDREIHDLKHSHAYHANVLSHPLPMSQVATGLSDARVGPPALPSHRQCRHTSSAVWLAHRQCQHCHTSQPQDLRLSPSPLVAFTVLVVSGTHQSTDDNQLQMLNKVSIKLLFYVSQGCRIIYK